MADIAALSNETIWQQYRHVHPLSGSADVTSYTVELALPELSVEPTEADWFPASWEATADADGYYLAYAEIGPGAGTVEMTAGTVYQIWLRLTLPTETPVVRGEEVSAY